MYIKAGRIKIHIGVPAAALFAFAANTSSGYIYILTVLTVFMHETVHILCLLYFGCRDIFLKINIGGIRLSAAGICTLSYKQMIITAISAPLFNISAGLAAGFICGDMTCIFSVINFTLGGLNLLLLPFLDGGRAFGAYIKVKTDIIKAEKLIKAGGIISVIIMLSVLIFLMLEGTGFFTLLIFTIYCFSELIMDKTGH